MYSLTVQTWNQARMRSRSGRSPGIEYVCRWNDGSCRYVRDKDEGRNVVAYVPPVLSVLIRRRWRSQMLHVHGPFG